MSLWQCICPFKRFIVRITVPYVSSASTNADNHSSQDYPKDRDELSQPLLSQAQLVVPPSRDRNTHFNAHDELLTQIHTALDPPYGPSSTRQRTPPVKCFALCGMGGIGKTEIAIQYIHRYGTAFDAIFWIDSASEEKLEDGFLNVAIKLGLQNHGAQSAPKAVRKAVHTWLKHPIQQKKADYSYSPLPFNWLIVFDNAVKRSCLAKFWPRGGPGSVLITSRNRNIRHRDTMGFNAVDVPLLTTSEASQLLHKLIASEAEKESDENCRAIARRLEGLPLAIVQVAYFMYYRHLSPKLFVEEYRINFTDFLRMGLPTEQTIAWTWNIESLSQSALALLQLMSVLDADTIPKDLPRCAPRILPYYPPYREGLLEAQGELLSSSLVSITKRPGFLTVHPLVQYIVRDRMEVDEFQRVLGVASEVLMSDQKSLLDLQQVDRLRRIQAKYIPHLLMWDELVVGDNGTLWFLCNQAAW
jgi:hypothetical protein